MQNVKSGKYQMTLPWA